MSPAEPSSTRRRTRPARQACARHPLIQTARDLPGMLMTRLHRSRFLLLRVSVIISAALAGCTPYPQPEAMADSFYLNPGKNPRGIGRVTLVELGNKSHYPEISHDVTRTLFMELQKKQVFGLTSIGRDDPGWPALQESFDSLHTVQGLGAMRENLKCNGLIVGEITEYRPYPRLCVGLRLRLIDLTDGQLFWAVEQVWDSTDRDVQRRIRAYARTELRYATGPVPEELVTLSTLEFVKFVATEVAQTLDVGQY